MKAFFIIFLSLLFFIQSISKLWVVANYVLNKEYISKNLCVNKAKPKMHCNGKCHLKKQLEKEDKKENSGTTSSKEKFEIQFCSPTKPLLQPKQQLAKNTQYHSRYLFSFSELHLLSIFHPPTV
jgi:hypothetical protein